VKIGEDLLGGNLLLQRPLAYSLAPGQREICFLEGAAYVTSEKSKERKDKRKEICEQGGTCQHVVKR